MIVFLLSFKYKYFCRGLGYCVHYDDVLKDSSHIHVLLVKDILTISLLTVKF